MEQIKIDR